MEFLDQVYFNNSILKWLTSAVILIGFTVLLYILRQLVLRAFRSSAENGSGKKQKFSKIVAAFATRTKFILVLIVSVYVASLSLKLPAEALEVIKKAAIVSVFFQLGIWISFMVVEGLRSYLADSEGEATASGLTVLRVMGTIIVWSLVLLAVMDNLGFDITSLVAGLGIGGIAIGLATQNVLGDIFASLSIVIDKPFVVGDFIIVGDKPGTVEKIGLKTTRVRALSGEELVFSNNDLLTSRIQNYKTLQERRIVFGFGILYSTPSDKLKQVAGWVREIIENTEKTRFDRAHFKGYGDSSLDFEVVYYVLEPDYAVYMDLQQKINLALFDKFEQEGIGFAFPSRTVYIEQSN